MKLMYLVMFDIEGTLVKSNDIDTICFCKAIKEVLGIDKIDTDWTHYSYVTDSGITSEIIEKFLGRKAIEPDLRAVHDSYLKKLHYEAENNPHYFQANPGASELMASLCSMENIAVALATGCWQNSALLKLETAGIVFKNIPLASADDSYERESIMIRAYERAKAHENRASFDSVTYVGDAIWDLTASNNLGYSFIAVGTRNQTELRNRGVIHIMDDLIDKDYFFKILGITNNYV